MPPVTPSTTRRPATALVAVRPVAVTLACFRSSASGATDRSGLVGCRGLDELALGACLGLIHLRLVGQGGRPDLVGGDLLEADRQRLAGNRADLRRHHGAKTLTELVEVGVDLPRPPGGEGDQAELGVDPIEKIL